MIVDMTLVSNAAGSKAQRLGVAHHAAVRNVEVQGPAVDGVVLRTAPVEAGGAPVPQRTVAVVQDPSDMHF